MDLKSRIEFYKKKALIRKNGGERNLAENYLKRARNNLIAMQVDYNVSGDEEVKKVLGLFDFKQYDWVIVKGYYAMYMAALSCLAKLGLKSENHSATVCALEFYFVDKGKLEEEYLELLKNILLEKDYVDNLKIAKENRIIAQYDVSEEFEKRKAGQTITDAKKFVDRFERLFYELK